VRHAGLLFLRRIVGTTLERSFGFGGRSGGAHRIHVLVGLETVDLDGLAIKAQALLLVGQEVLNILALVSLQLDHLSHLSVCDDGAIAGKLLLDDFENLLLVELLGQSLDGGQSLTTITLLNTNMDVVLLSGLYFSSSIISLRERIEGLEILDVRGHEIDWWRSAGAERVR